MIIKGLTIKQFNKVRTIPQFSTNSMFLDRVNEYIKTPSNSVLNIITALNPLTFSIWVKPSSLTASTQTLFSKYSSPRGYYLAIDNAGRIRFDMQENGGASGFRVTSTTTVNFGVWNHVVLTYDGSRNANGANIYLDSVLSAKTISFNTLTGNINTSADFEFGRLVGSNLFGGYLDDFRMWDVEFNQTQVDAEFNGGKIPTPTEVGNLVARCALGEGGTWDGSNWTLPDEVNAFTYTSVNMEFSDNTNDVA